MHYLNTIYLILATLFIQVSACQPKENEQKLPDPTTEFRSVQNNSTTFILVRHAEKDTVKGDPNLTEEGHARAQDLARFLSDTPVTQVYSSDYKRTRQTAQPTAKAKGLEVKLFNPRENSTPTFVNTLLGESKMEKIDESHYDNIFIVKVLDIGTAEVMHLHYGK